MFCRRCCTVVFTSKYVLSLPQICRNLQSPAFWHYRWIISYVGTRKIETLSTQPVLYRKMKYVARNYSTNNTFHFNHRKAVLLKKMTRYEFEKINHPEMTDAELKSFLESKRSDYEGLLVRHKKQYQNVEYIKNLLGSHGIETRVLDRFQFNSSAIQWADLVFTAGGDGTFLLAASKIRNRKVPLIGINTDPTRSEGYLCLPKEKYPVANLENAIKRIISGNFKWKWRQRIRITMSGHHDNDEPIELHDQQLSYPEQRYFEHVEENENFRIPVSDTGDKPPERVLPVLALNEVFLAESLSARVSYYEMSINDQPSIKQKSSGVTVCTGTGSSSWYFHINHVHKDAVKEILSIAERHAGKNTDPMLNENMIHDITNNFNSLLLFNPSEPRMAYTIRDPVMNAVFQVKHPRGFAEKIWIRSRMWDACIVIDGGSSFKFNDGAVATLEIHEEDALRTVTLDD